MKRSYHQSSKTTFEYPKMLAKKKKKKKNQQASFSVLSSQNSNLRVLVFPHPPPHRPVSLTHCCQGRGRVKKGLLPKSHNQLLNEWPSVQSAHALASRESGWKHTNRPSPHRGPPENPNPRHSSAEEIEVWTRSSWRVNSSSSLKANSFPPPRVPRSLKPNRSSDAACPQARQHSSRRRKICRRLNLFWPQILSQWPPEDTGAR